MLAHLSSFLAITKSQTGSKSSPFWILHGAIFRLVHGENTSGEFVDPSTGVRIPKPDVTKNLETAVQQHPRPLATTLDFLDHSICEIDGDEDLAVNGVEVCEVNPGADTHDVRRLLMAESRCSGLSHFVIRLERCLSGDLPKVAWLCCQLCRAPMRLHHRRWQSFRTAKF